MAEWTPEAQQRLAGYLADVERLAGKQGLDGHELVDELRAHIIADTEASAGDVITRDHVEKTLAVVGSPERILGAEPPNKPSSPQKLDTPLCLPAQPPSRYRAHVLVALFGLVIPIFSFCFELLFPVMDNTFYDPFQTPIHLIAGVIVLFSIGLSHYVLISHPTPVPKRLTGLALALNAFTFFWALQFTIIYIPIIPFAFIAILFIGLGLMGFTPIFCTIIAFYQAHCLKRYCLENGLDKKWLRRRVLLGFAVGLTLCAYYLIMPVLRFHALHKACSENPSEQAEGLHLLRTLNGEQLVHDLCNPGEFPIPALFNYWVPNDRYSRVTTFSKIHYQLTGLAPDQIPLSRLSFGNQFRNERISTPGYNDESIRGAGIARNLSLQSSAMDISIRRDEESNTAPAWAYIEWTLTFQNEMERPGETRGQIALPHDAVASRLTLWIEGEEREAAFGERSLVRAAYQSVAVVQRRDPALLMQTASDQISLKCFPVPAHGTMKVKVGISTPITVRDGKGYVCLPYFLSRNFQIADSLPHTIWAKSPAPFSSIDNAATAQSLQQGGYELHMTMDNQTIESPEHNALVMDAAGLAGKTFSGSLAELSASITLHTAEDSKEPRALFFVIDGSIQAKGANIDWESVCRDIPEGTLVNAIFAGFDGDQKWAESFKPIEKTFVSWLRSRKYAGGCDPAHALKEAIIAMDAVPNGAVVWVQSSMPIPSSGAEGLQQILRHRHDRTSVIFVVPATPGRNLLYESMGYANSIERVPVTGSYTNTLRYVCDHFHTEDLVRAYTLNTSTVPIDPNVDLSHQADIVRFAMHDQACEAIAHPPDPDNNNTAALAARTRIVSPLSGAVVLENAGQYRAHDLDPGQNNDAIPGIPEPEEWALLFIVLIIVAWLFWQQRRSVRGTA